MKYIVDISPKQAQTIQKLLDKGIYGSLSQFISASVENQLALEENETSELTPYRMEKAIQQQSVTKVELRTGGFEKYQLVNIPEFNSVIAPPEFSNLVFASQKIPEKQAWIWGQVNKIFPVKLGLRVLHQLLATKQSIELNEFLEAATKEAILFGEKIRSYEKNAGKMRDEKISAALPSMDEKSQTRYKFQFMVYPRKDGLLDGAMALMRFCNVYADRKKQMIGITEAGLKFSSINNPVMDNNNLDQSLSEEESLFYITHAKENIKGEYEAMKWMLQQISNGKNERELLNNEIEKTFGKTWKATAVVINTQRAGLTARMFELGLIEKEKDGIYVKYEVSEIGKTLFLK